MMDRPFADHRFPALTPRVSSLTRVRFFLKKVLLLSLSIASVLVLLELVFRFVLYQPQPLLVKDTLIGQRYRAGFHARYYVGEADREIDLRFNRDGFRGRDVNEKKSAQVQRMAILGDSYVAGIAVNEHETLVERLGQLLNQPGPSTNDADRWEMLNLGISGNSTAQSLLIWRQFARPYDPDVVVLCFYNGNDLSDNHPKLSSAHRPFFTLDGSGELSFHPMSPTLTSISRWLADNSRFYVWQKDRMRGLRDRFRNLFEVAPPGLEIFDSKPVGVYEEAWKLTETLIANLAREVREQGAAFVLVSIPCHEQIDDTSWERLLDCVGAAAEQYDRHYPERRLADICSRQSIPFVPLIDSLGKRSEIEPVFLPNNGHWNAVGQETAAEAIYRSLQSIRQTAN